MSRKSDSRRLRCSRSNRRRARTRSIIITTITIIINIIIIRIIGMSISISIGIIIIIIILIIIIIIIITGMQTLDQHMLEVLPHEKRQNTRTLEDQSHPLHLPETLAVFSPELPDTRVGYWGQDSSCFRRVFRGSSLGLVERQHGSLIRDPEWVFCRQQALNLNLIGTLTVSLLAPFTISFQQPETPNLSLEFRALKTKEPTRTPLDPW